MIIKSKDVLVNMIQMSLPYISQIGEEKKVPDVSSGPGIMIQLDSSKLEPISGALSTGTVGWRLSYYPNEAGRPKDVYGAFNTIIEAVYDKPVNRDTEKTPFKVTKANIIRTTDGIFLKLVMSTTIQRNQESYDPMRDVKLTTGG